MSDTITITAPRGALIGTVLAVSDANTSDNGKAVRNINVAVKVKGREIRVRVAGWGRHAGAMGKLKKDDRVKIAGASVKTDTWPVTVEGKELENSRLELVLNDGDESATLTKVEDGSEDMSLIQGFGRVYYCGDMEEVGANKTKKREVLVGFLFPGDEGIKAGPSLALTILGKDAREAVEKGADVVIEAAIDNQYWEPKDSKENRYKAGMTVAAQGHRIAKIAAPAAA